MYGSAGGCSLVTASTVRMRESVSQEARLDLARWNVSVCANVCVCVPGSVRQEEWICLIPWIGCVCSRSHACIHACARVFAYVCANVCKHAAQTCRWGGHDTCRGARLVCMLIWSTHYLACACTEMRSHDARSPTSIKACAEQTWLRFALIQDSSMCCILLQQTLCRIRKEHALRWSCDMWTQNEIIFCAVSGLMLDGTCTETVLQCVGMKWYPVLLSSYFCFGTDALHVHVPTSKTAIGADMSSANVPIGHRVVERCCWWIVFHYVHRMIRRDCFSLPASW